MSSPTFYRHNVAPRRAYPSTHFTGRPGGIFPGQERARGLGQSPFPTAGRRPPELPLNVKSAIDQLLLDGTADWGYPTPPPQLPALHLGGGWRACPFNSDAPPRISTSPSILQTTTRPPQILGSELGSFLVGLPSCLNWRGVENVFVWDGGKQRGIWGPEEVETVTPCCFLPTALLPMTAVLTGLKQLLIITVSSSLVGQECRKDAASLLYLYSSDGSLSQLRLGRQGGARCRVLSLSAWGTWAAASTTASGKEDFLPAISGLPEDGRGTYSRLKGQARNWPGASSGLTCQVRNLPRLKTRAIGPTVGGEHVKVPSILYSPTFPTP